MNKPAAGWFPDPSGQPGQRYYDGQRWTQHFVPTPSPNAPAPPAVAVSSGGGPNALPAPPTPPPPPFGWYPPLPAPEQSTLYLPNLIAAMIASVGVVIGSLGPWLTFLVFDRTATDGDGAITLVLGVVATAALFVILNLGRSRTKTGWMTKLGCTAALVGAVAFLVGGADALDVTSRKVALFGRTVGPQIGWGLWLVLIMSLVLTVTATVVVKQVLKVDSGNRQRLDGQVTAPSGCPDPEQPRLDTPPEKKPIPRWLIVGASLLGIFLSAWVANDWLQSASPAALAAHTATPFTTLAPVTPVTPTKPNPYEANGTWLVPSEIKPGTYRTELAPGQTSGYYRICADYTCALGTPGFIHNELLNGPGVLVVPPNAVSVQLTNLILTPMAGL